MFLTACRSIAADVGQKLDNIISDMSGTTLSGDRDANLTRYSENEATSSVRIGMVVHELNSPLLREILVPP
jgi:hypothetical protein